MPFFFSLLDFPCAISLLSGKSTEIYKALFSELEFHAERLKMKFEPKHIMSDFEMSLIKCIKQKVCVLSPDFSLVSFPFLVPQRNASWMLFSLLSGSL